MLIQAHCYLLLFLTAGDRFRSGWTALGIMRDKNSLFFKIGFLKNCTGERDRKEQLITCDNGKEKLYIINQGARAAGDICGLHACF